MKKDSRIQGVFIIITVILVVVSLVSGALIYKSYFVKPPETVIVNSQSIVNRISDTGILVTKTVYLDQEVTIEIDNGSDWSNFWWGQEIIASALVKSNIGVDLSGITEDDIIVDEKSKIIEIKLPDAYILSTSIDGDIDVEVKNGVFKGIFDKDNNEDYSLAIIEIKNAAEKTINSESEILIEARSSTIDILNLIITDTGYTLKLEQ